MVWFLRAEILKPLLPEKKTGLWLLFGCLSDVRACPVRKCSGKKCHLSHDYVHFLFVLLFPDLAYRLLSLMKRSS